WTWSFNVYFSGSMVLAGGLLAGTIFGLYLLITCRLLGVHANDAFSAMSLDSYKNFIRIRIKWNRLTLYPIGISQVPFQKAWGPNSDCANDPRAPIVVSTNDIEYRLIEGPIEVS